MNKRHFGAREVGGTLLFVFFAALLVRNTQEQGNDFNVFWNSARYFVAGQSIYTWDHSNGMFFKYPPWVFPLFIPFGFFSLTVSRLLWGLVQVASLFFILRECIQLQVSGWILFFSSLFFALSIWWVHALDGQISLTLLAMVMVAYRCFRKTRPSVFFTVTVWALSVKIVHMGALSALRSRWLKALKAFAVSALSLSLLSLPALWVERNHSVSELFDHWRLSAATGGQFLGTDKIFSRDNQGLPALVIRKMHLSSVDGKLELILSVVFFAAYWLITRKRWREQTAFYAALGVLSAVHPLAWFHQFVWAFPLVVLALQKADTRARRVAAVLGGILITAMTRKVFGHCGEWMELYSIKAWGVLLCVWALPPEDAAGSSFQISDHR